MNIFGNMKAEHVMIGTNDYEGTITWYKEMLGFKIKHEWLVPEFPNLKLAYIEKNGFLIEIVASPDTPTPKRSKDLAERLMEPGIGHFAFLVDDVDVASEQLFEKGVKFIMPPTSFPDSGRRLSFFEDNNGNLIEILKELPLGERSEYTGERND